MLHRLNRKSFLFPRAAFAESGAGQREGFSTERPKRSTRCNVPVTYGRTLGNTPGPAFKSTPAPGKIAGLVRQPLTPLGGILSDSDSDVEQW